MGWSSLAKLPSNCSFRWWSFVNAISNSNDREKRLLTCSFHTMHQLHFNGNSTVFLFSPLSTALISLSTLSCLINGLTKNWANLSNDDFRLSFVTSK